MTAEQKLLLDTLATEADLAVTYTERGMHDTALVHMRRVSDALKDLVTKTRETPFR